MSNFAAYKKANMIIGYILLYGMPSLLAQGLLFVGFIYCLAFFLRLVESLFKKKKTVETKAQPKAIAEKHRNPVKEHVAPKRFKYIIKIKSDVAKIDNDSQYVLFDIKSIYVGDKQLLVHEVTEPIRTLNNFGAVQECIETFWRIEIDDMELNESEFNLICLSKDSAYNGFSIYSGSQIIYKGQRFPMQRIEDTQHISGYQSAYAFDNWVASRGLNNRTSIADRENKRIK